MFGVFQFINDLEKDRQYWGWPSELQEVHRAPILKLDLIFFEVFIPVKWFICVES